MNVRLTRKFGFESAHRLPNVPASHKCARLHGHSFRVEVSVRGPVDEAMGWFMDYAEIDRACRTLTELLDHRYLNEIEGLENPTSERLAQFIWQRLIALLPCLDSVVVLETCESRCEYRGD